MNLAGFPGGGVLGAVITIVVLAAASALVTGVLVEDDITAGFRRAVWRRFPRTGDGDPVPDLDGSGWEPSRGSFLGNMLTCVRCTGVWVTMAWVIAYSFAHVGVVHVAVVPAAMQVQRLFNAWTRKAPSSPTY